MATKKKYNIALAGNPNTGKTSVFNAVTGMHQHVGNFPGVTVEKKIGFKEHKGTNLAIIDLPGTYTLSKGTLDEQVATSYLINETPDLVINVLDAGNLSQGLYLTTHLVDMGLPLILVLNMWDEVEKNNIKIDIERISNLLQVPVITTQAHKNKGVDKLLDAIAESILSPQKKLPHPDLLRYDYQIEEELKELSNFVRTTCEIKVNPHWAATELLSGNLSIVGELTEEKSVATKLKNLTALSRDKIMKVKEVEAGTAMEAERFSSIDRLVSLVSDQSKSSRMKRSVTIDNFVTNKYLGYPIFLFVMWLIFKTTFSLGAYPMDWINNGVAWIQEGIQTHLPEHMFTSLLSDGVVGGVGAVVVFLPNIILLFLCISLLETTGYIARAAFISDRLMHTLGLHGQSFIPLLTGFGCSVPAIMATRTLRNEKERILSTLLVPFMSCSAKLPIYVLFVSVFWGDNGSNVIFLIYGIGILLSFVAAKFHKRFTVKPIFDSSIMEMPPYRIPSLKSISYHTWNRTKVYLLKMGGVILIGSIILWFAANFPTPPEEYTSDHNTSTVEQTMAKDKAAMEYSIIGRFGKFTEPFFRPLGFNWQMGVALFTGFVAKEVVVSTLGVLYHSESGDDLGKSLASENSGITKLSAFSFLIFVLLYTPCFATIAVTRRELGWKWMWFMVFFQATVAYLFSFITFQVGSLLLLL